MATSAPPPTDSPARLSWRYRPTWRARLHYFFWSAILILFWPLAAVLRIIEKAGTSGHSR